jgi:MoxR-like ATPase
MIWFEKLGYDKNPLSIKPTDAYGIIGRDELITDLLSSIQEGTLCALIGQYGLGKTSMLKQIVNQFKGKKKVAYFSCNRLTGPLDLDRIIHERFGAIGRLLQIKSKKMILLLDEVEYLKPGDFRNIQQYLTEGYFHSIVLVTNEKKTIPIPVKVFELKALEEDHAVEIIRQRLGKNSKKQLSDAIIKKVYEHDPRIRKFLQNTCKILKKCWHTS